MTQRRKGVCWSSRYSDRWVVLFASYENGLEVTSPVGFALTKRGAEKLRRVVECTMRSVGGPFSVAVERAR